MIIILLLVTECQKTQAKDLPCIFANLVDLYTDKGLKPCATKNNQTWRYASSKAAAKILQAYFMKLSNLNAGKIDTPVVRKKRSCRNNILETHSSISSINNDTTIQFTEAEFANNESVPIEEFQRIKNLLKLHELECWNKSQLIVELNNEITQLSHQLEDQNHEIFEVQDQNKVPYERWNLHIEQLSHQLGTQPHEIKDLKRKLVDSYDQLTEAMEKTKFLLSNGIWILAISQNI
ncbi:1311_t:CDS:2 [Entrophospora sp. SA101]|nr:1311_t:CDS:2 [Entrophospora sp. SA101]